MDINFQALAAPFPSQDIEWRIQQAGAKNGRPWAKCLAYVTNRAIMERLDTVVGPANWSNRFEVGPGGGILCGIAIRIGDEWITKWDGAENTDIEAVKGGLSGAMKRAAVQWSIGRYLYKLEEGWANIHDNGEYFGKAKDGGSFRWDPPALPAWALPEGSSEQKVASKEKPQARKKAPEPEPSNGEATPKQIALIERLAGSHHVDDVWRDRILRQFEDEAGMTTTLARQTIDALKAKIERGEANERSSAA